MPAVLFVCLGNICRSPCAEGVLLHLARTEAPGLDLHVESCGLGDWHQGHLPDPRMRHAAEQRGIILTSKAKAFAPEFFDRFDYILAADDKVLYQIHRWAEKPEHKAKIHLMTRFSEVYPNESIPDPYYHGEDHFELVIDMIDDACRGLLRHLKG